MFRSHYCKNFNAVLFRNFAKTQRLAISQPIGIYVREVNSGSKVTNDDTKEDDKEKHIKPRSIPIGGNRAQRRKREFSVDRSGLLGVGADGQPLGLGGKILSRILTSSEGNLPSVVYNEERDKEEVQKELDEEKAMLEYKEPLSPLARDLRSYIKLKGPITLHDFMAQSLNHSVHGYYQHNIEKEKIGDKGDFITSPEISQLFGEMIAVWCLGVWQSLGSPKAVDIIELGPGKGTMMGDILRVANRFPSFKKAANVHLVELSETMRSLQRDTLGCSLSQESADQKVNNTVKGTTNTNDNANGMIKVTSKDGIPITWYSYLHQVPLDVNKPVIILGQEFLDAFPVHQFAYTKLGWREKLVDVDDSRDSKFYFRVVLSPTATPACRTLLGEDRVSPSNDATIKPGGSIGQGANHKHFQGKRAFHPDLKEGDGVEVCPLALATMEDITSRILKCSGASLIIDYGENFTQADSLRGFKKHTQVDFLSEPGLVDMTADVDFSACARVALRRGGGDAGKVKIAGPIQQGEFLMRMGIIPRLEKLIELPSTTDEQANKLVNSMKMLIEEERMGKRFKVMSLASASIAHHIPGFPLPSDQSIKETEHSSGK